MRENRAIRKVEVAYLERLWALQSPSERCDGQDHTVFHAYCHCGYCSMVRNRAMTNYRRRKFGLG